MSIVLTNVPYSYSILRSNIDALFQEYPFLEVQTIGYSQVLGRSIPCIRIGKGSKHVLYAASFHANEWITTPVFMKWLEEYCIAYVSDSNLLGFRARQLFEMVTIHLVPMVNPDGVDLLTDPSSIPVPVYQLASQIASSYPSIPFPNGWKANLNGVDLKNYQPVCKVL